MNGAPATDPFSMTAAPGAYVPRAATESALDAAEYALRAGQRKLAITGPAGIGKTTLMRVLEQRLAGGFRVAFAPYSALGPEEIVPWLLGLLGVTPGDNPERTLLAEAADLERDGRALLLLLDDASSLPVATARRLGQIVDRARGGIRLIAACFDDARAGPVLSALGPIVEEIRLADPMSEEETGQYLQQRLARAEAPDELRARFDPSAVRALHREAAGIPRVLHTLADELSRGMDPASGSMHPAPRLEIDAPAAAAPEPPRVAIGITDVVPSRPLSEWIGDVPDEAAGPGPSISASGARVAFSLMAILLAIIASAVWLRPRTEPPQGVPTASSITSVPPVAYEPPTAEAPAPTLATGPPEVLPSVPSAAVPPVPSAPIVPIAAPVVVNFNATPWAEIHVDGVRIGETPLAGISLAQGPHQVEARFPDGRVVARPIQVSPEQRHFSFGH